MTFARALSSLALASALVLPRWRRTLPSGSVSLARKPSPSGKTEPSPGDRLALRNLGHVVPSRQGAAVPPAVSAVRGLLDAEL